MKRISWLAAGGLASCGATRLAGADRSRRFEAVTVPLLAFTPHAAAAALLGSLLLRRQGADVLFLQELTEPAVSRLKQAGLTDLLPHELTDLAGPSARGRGIYARFPLTESPDLGWPETAQLTARLELPGGRRADLVCVHTPPPRPPWSPANTARWRSELAALPDPARSAADPPRVLAGDFNASVDHACFRQVLRLGHVDAAARFGRGLVPTWGPGPWGRPALLTIDHVLVDPGCAVQAVSVYPLPGSDHRAVYAEFRLPSAP